MSAVRQSESFPGRDFYKSKGGANWGRLLPWLLAAFIVAGALAFGMFQLIRIGHYYPLIVPAVAALAVAGMIRLAVNKGHCRSAAIGGAMGLIAGVMLYFGYFYCGMIYQVGPEAGSHPDWLPGYIRARMETDVIRDAHRPRNEDYQRPRRGGVVFNWLFFGAEVIVVLSITTGAGIQRSRKTYCEACQQWMLRDVTQFDPAQSTPLLEALRTGSARSLAAFCASPVFATVPNTTLAIEFCPSVKEGRSRDCPVYASLKQVTQAAGNPALDPFDSSKGKVLLRALQLSPDELAACGSRFSVLESIAGRSAVAALKPEPAAETAEVDAAALAEIKPVEADYAGKVLTRRAAWFGNAMAIGGLLMIFASIGLAAWGGTTAFPDAKSKQEVTPSKKAAGIALLVLGIAGFAGTAVFFFVNPAYFGNRYLLKRTRLEFARRPKCLVDANDPDALFIEIVPKLNWGKMMLENASDVGFLRVDARRREILFEGDKQRFRIPAAAITYCAMEVFVEGQGSHAATRIYYVVLRALQPGEFWEAPIRERSGSGKLLAGRRKKAAERLFESIQQVRGVPSATVSPR